jgi:Mg2+-importing ATPase
MRGVNGPGPPAATAGASAAVQALERLPLGEVMRQLGSRPDGLSAEEARVRQARATLPRHRRQGRLLAAVALFAGQLKSSIVLLLLGAATVSFFVGGRTDSLIILGIVLCSAGLGFLQEHRAARAMEALLARVQVTATVRRDGQPVAVPLDQVVPGDVVVLAAGDIVPADARLIESRDLFVDEAALTGEDYPVEKQAGAPPGDGLLHQPGAVHLGTHVVSGTGQALALATGDQTRFGRIAGRLRLRPPETDFERGLRRFGHLLMEVTLVLVLLVFASSAYFHRPVIDSLLFAVALAVGLTPQLLPAVVSVNLAHGAARMAARKVIVKRLTAIENFGAMDVLCTDKTGTLTESTVALVGATDATGAPGEWPRFLAALNAHHECGFHNPIDEALRAARPLTPKEAYPKLDELPYDFQRKRLSVLVGSPDGPLMVTKGAWKTVGELCSRVAIPGQDGALREEPIGPWKGRLDAQLQAQGERGERTLAVAYRRFADGRRRIDRADETDLVLAGLVAFSAPLKEGAPEALAELGRLGVQVKVITGDSARAAAALARRLGLDPSAVLTGAAIDALSDAALRLQAGASRVFAEVEPRHKERLVVALKKGGHVVGFMGDGINDVPALHAADVSISVDGAVDVAKEAADIVLLDRDLDVLTDGVLEGRRTFGNTLKYVFMATSANFGNMFSMAGASVLVPFLPMLPKQLLFTNLMTDLPEMAICTDDVDAEWVERPRRWDLRFIRRFMVSFGLLSSLFDYLTFGFLLWLLAARRGEFRTGWFVESVLSAALAVLVIRTRRPLHRSRPGTGLWVATVGVVLLTLAVPYTPLGRLLGFVPLGVAPLCGVLAIVTTYVLSCELLKRAFYRQGA